MLSESPGNLSRLGSVVGFVVWFGFVVSFVARTDGNLSCVFLRHSSRLLGEWIPYPLLEFFSLQFWPLLLNSKCYF